MTMYKIKFGENAKAKHTHDLIIKALEEKFNKKANVIYTKEYWEVSTIEVDDVEITVNQLYRHNGTDQNTSFIITGWKQIENSTRLKSIGLRVKIPFNASEKVIKNRIALVEINK